MRIVSETPAGSSRFYDAAATKHDIAESRSVVAVAVVNANLAQSSESAATVCETASHTAETGFHNWTHFHFRFNASAHSLRSSDSIVRCSSVTCVALFCFAVQYTYVRRKSHVHSCGPRDTNYLLALRCASPHSYLTLLCSVLLCCRVIAF